ncbi:hypothetical protein ACTU3I_10685 [Microbacterium sp. RD1]|uniref:hypothetical protein n=1 Tax=Microbacterium sp. RD1 TaxID=3457313 RepID=UPI003FA5D63C
MRRPESADDRPSADRQSSAARFGPIATIDTIRSVRRTIRRAPSLERAKTSSYLNAISLGARTQQDPGAFAERLVDLALAGVSA